MATETICDIGQFSEEEYLDLFSKYIVKYHTKGIEQILSFQDETQHYSLIVNYSDLMQYDVQLAALLFNYPRLLLPVFDEAIEEVQNAIISVPIQELAVEDERSVKKNCHARIVGVSLESFKTVNLPKSLDVGALVAIGGTVIRTGSLKIMEKKKDLKCSKCKQTFTVHVDLEQENAFPRVTQCKTIINGVPCPGKVFADVEGSSEMTNYQEIKVQEQIQSLAIGSIPRSVIVVLTDDLADCCQPGDNVSIVGIVMRRWKYLSEGERCNVNTFLLANHIHVRNEREFNVHITEELTAEFTEFWAQYNQQPMIGRDTVLRSVCPQVYGMYYVKLSFLLVLIGGVPQVTAEGLKVRGESHLLLVGEPGTGKSQFLKYGAKLGQRSVLTTGTGSTSAGLTVSAMRDQGGEWILEAGALVLSDGGVCCIDEFNCIKQQDRATIHEAMEQQTLSVAKAGLVCKLNSRATVIAACNPKGGYDPENDISVNLGIASPLLSRFDLVLILNDTKDQAWDDQVSSFILNGVDYQDDVSLWNIDKLKSYIAFVKATLNPSLTPEAQEVLTSYYHKQRMTGNQNQARTTIRLLQSMVRLTQAHARLMFRTEATLVDAVTTIILIECSAHCTALCGISSALYSLFPDDPTSTYLEKEQIILDRLGLNHLGSGLDATYHTVNEVDDDPPSPTNGAAATRNNHVDTSALNSQFKEEQMSDEDDEILPTTTTTNNIVVNNSSSQVSGKLPHQIYAKQSTQTPVQPSSNGARVPTNNNLSRPTAPKRTNIWSKFSQKEPELLNDTTARIAADKNPIDSTTAKGLELRLQEQAEERRINREKELAAAAAAIASSTANPSTSRLTQTTLWDSYNFTENDLNDQDFEEIDKLQQQHEEQESEEVDPPTNLGKRSRNSTIAKKAKESHIGTTAEQDAVIEERRKAFDTLGENDNIDEFGIFSSQPPTKVHKSSQAGLASLRAGFARANKRKEK